MPISVRPILKDWILQFLHEVEAGRFLKGYDAAESEQGNDDRWSCLQ